MLDSLYNLFRNCFPGIIRSEQTVRQVLSAENNHIITREENHMLTAAAVVNENHIVMLCVLPEYRGHGLGSALLAECEDAIRGQGYQTILFSPGSIDYLTPGIPMEFAPYEHNRAFFEKRGYFHNWGDTECVDMMLDMKASPALDVGIGDTVSAVSKQDPTVDPNAPENRITYRFAKESDIERTVDCVAEALEEFVQYYRNPALYREEGSDRVLIAENGNGFICGALLVSAGGEAPNLGSVGCTSTRASCQGRGIATNMVKAGTRFLKEQGLAYGYLGYTYTAIIPMYARSGYRVSMKYFMGEKQL